MAKNITRTLDIYTYTFGVFDQSTMQMRDLRQVQLPYKPGKRLLDKIRYMDEILVGENVEHVLYKMSLEEFYTYGKPVTQEDEEEEETEEEENEN